MDLRKWSSQNIKTIRLQNLLFILINSPIKIGMSISHFASTVNHPICQYLDTFPFHKANAKKQQIYFLSGDPTIYGSNSFKMPEQGYQMLRKEIANPESHGYTLSSGIPTAREAILKLYKPKNKVPIEHVVIQHGVNQGLLVTLMAFTNPGDQILVPETGYPIFQKLAPALHVKAIPYKLKPNQNYEVDLENLASLITDRTQFLFVINPSNPMGTIFSLEHMKDIINFCDKHQIPIVSDEVYHGQAFEGHTFYSFGDVTDDVPVLVLCGVEKLFTVPGWSTSWTVLFDKHNYLQNVWKNIVTTGMIFLHTNKFTQQALPQIIEKVGLFTRNPIKQTQAMHDQIYNEFNAIKGYRAVKAAGTFYMIIILDMATFKDLKTDKQYIQKLIEEQNVALLPLSIFGGDQNGFRLLTIAKPQVHTQFFLRIKEFNSRHQAQQ